MNEVTYKEILSEEEGQRLDNYLIRILKGVPRSHIYRIIRSGEVRVNQKRAQASTRIHEGDKVRVPPVRVSNNTPSNSVNKNLKKYLLENILYEDEGLLVINKPSGIAVHGGSGLSLGIIEALRKIRSDLAYIELVHRLDKETSGCLLLAKKRSVLRAIQALLEKREVNKTYWALLQKPWQGKAKRVVNAALTKNILQSGERMVFVSENGKPSETQFMLLENFKNACLVSASPKTGRTHQIRVHSAYLQHPIIGDPKYGQIDFDKQLNIGKIRLYLHAHSIQFTLNGKKHYYEAKLDDKFNLALQQLRARNGLTHE